jgi:hypothetical protein
MTKTYKEERLIRTRDYENMRIELKVDINENNFDDVDAFLSTDDAVKYVREFLDKQEEELRQKFQPFALEDLKVIVSKWCNKDGPDFLEKRQQQAISVLKTFGYDKLSEMKVKDYEYFVVALNHQGEVK